MPVIDYGLGEKMREPKKVLKGEEEIVKALKHQPMTLAELTDKLTEEETKNGHKEYMNAMNRTRGTLMRLIKRKKIKTKMIDSERGDFEKKTLYEVAA